MDPERARSLRKLRDAAGVQRGLSHLRADAEALTQLQIEIARTPTGDARAEPRARMLEAKLKEAGIADLRRDAAGNVLGVVPGTSGRSVVLSAHLDTVFPTLEHIDIEREGPVLRGPGISDDAAGLTALVFLAQALCEARLELQHDVLFACTVGEEGEGDLCGVKHLFAQELDPRRVIAFLTLDLGGQQTIVHEGLGSRRFHVTLRGPGGHSWGDFGRPNPAHALTRGLARFVENERGKRGVATFNVGTLEGGRGVNVIPETASARVDLRATHASDLEALERRLRAALNAGLESERAWSTDGAALTLDVRVIGDRPSGATPADSQLVRTCVAAFANAGIEVRLAASSTDANAPMSLGVPAVALPHGARAHNAHSLDEWCDVRGREPVLDAIFLTMVALAGC